MSDPMIDTGDYNMAPTAELFLEVLGSLRSAVLDLDRVAEEANRIPPPKAVCPDLLIGFKSMPYVMRYSNFSH